MSLKIPLNKVSTDKISVSFTWDDNSIRHFSIISPLFIKNGFRCTFYIVPGSKDFDSIYSFGYAKLAESGFEIGSHSFTHQYMSTLIKEQSDTEFKEAVTKIQKCINQYPATFAFPNHDYNNDLIKQALLYHLETRNTLFNSRRFSFKTNTSLNEIIDSINDAILSKTNLIFSGHSVLTEDEFAHNLVGEGYEPIRFSVLSDLLPYMRTITSKVDVVTFLQATLKEIVMKSATYQNKWCVLPQNVLEQIYQFNLTDENIISLL